MGSIFSQPVINRVSSQSRISPLRRAWNALFAEENNDIDIEAQIEVTPPQNEPTPTIEAQVQGAGDEVYLKTAWLSLNGKPLNRDVWISRV